MDLAKLKQFATDRQCQIIDDSRWAKQVGQRAITITDIIRLGEY